MCYDKKVKYWHHKQPHWTWTTIYIKSIYLFINYNFDNNLIYTSYISTIDQQASTSTKRLYIQMLIDLASNLGTDNIHLPSCVVMSKDMILVLILL